MYEKIKRRMNDMKKLKKLFITLIIACLVIIAFGEISNVKAESAGPMYLGIVSLRRSGYGYTQSGKKVWKIAQYTSTNEQEVPDKNKTIYCIKLLLNIIHKISKQCFFLFSYNTVHCKQYG